jgi:hypothetical protein
MRVHTERLRLEYRDSVSRAKELIASVPTASLRKKPEDGGWCAAECIDHLNLTAEDYIRRIRDAIGEATVRPPRREEKLSMAGRFYVRNFEPPIRRRFNAAATIVPSATGPRIDVLINRFETIHQQLIRLVEETDAIDRLRIRIPYADSEWIRLTLYDTFCLLAAHDRRHLWQAEEAARV